MDEPFDAVGDLNEKAEGDYFGHPTRQFAARRGLVGERLERVRLRSTQREPRLQVCRVELEKLAHDMLTELDDVRGCLITAPGQLGQRDEPDTGKDRMCGPPVQRHEHTKTLDRCDGARESLAAAQRLKERPEIGVLRLST